MNHEPLRPVENPDKAWKTVIAGRRAMSRRELIEKIEKAFEMVIAVSGRMFRIVRDEEDWLTIGERNRLGSEKHYSDTNQMISRYKIDGKPLREYMEGITIIQYTALLDA